VKNNYTNQPLLLPYMNSRHYLILFLLWPFLAFLTAVANYSRKEEVKVIYIFFIYYGLSFVIRGEVYDDSLGYAMRLKENAALPFSDFFKIVGGLYSDTSVDIVEPLISFIVSRFTSNHIAYFTVMIAIFGFFYLKSINLLYDRYKDKPGWNALIMMSFFVMLSPITSIVLVRMSIATWIFFYGACHVIFYRDSKYLLLTLGSSLVHWSFISANVVLIIYFLAGNRNFFYLPLVVISFILPSLMGPALQAISMRLGGPLQARFEGYSSESTILEYNESYRDASWFMGLSQDLVFYYLLIVLIVIQLRFGNLMKEKDEINLFSFLLLFLSFYNFGKAIPTFGDRFQVVFFLFATLYVFLFSLKITRTKVNLLTLIGLFPMLLYSAIIFRNGSESISAWILTPGVGLPFIAPGLSLADLLFR
jgi:hypothetical protein